MRPFPPGFLFGCATSAYQVEGGITNDWSRWESAGRLKDPAGRCGAAADHWNRWEEDFDLLSSLGATAYRFSVEWARIEPAPGVFDPAALARYADMVRALRARGIEPFVTLLHFTHPTWFHETSPWHDESGECVRRFERFAREVGRALPEVRRWTILNEPGPWLVGAYVAGLIPPGEKSLTLASRAFTNLVRAHARARLALREVTGEAASIGLAHNVMRFVPSRERHPGDRLLARYVARLYNHAFPSALSTGRVELGVVPGLRWVREVPEARGSLDFLGVNYYSRMFLELEPRVRGLPVHPFYEDRGGLGQSDLGWEIHPAGLTEALEEMSARYGLPLYVTENGIDDRDDTRRSTFLYDHLEAVLDGITRGADVRGYLHWSLIDNFEWLEGFEPRFGLFSVDYATQLRSPTRAAELFRQVTRARALPGERPASTPRSGRGRVRAF